eukprot:6198804-Pleurochrysis_carterae.AAC.1
MAQTKFVRSRSAARQTTARRTAARTSRSSYLQAKSFMVICTACPCVVCTFMLLCVDGMADPCQLLPCYVLDDCDCAQAIDKLLLPNAPGLCKCILVQLENRVHVENLVEAVGHLVARTDEMRLDRAVELS